MDYSLGFVFPGECYEVRKKILDAFNEQMLNACKKSKSVSDCCKETPKYYKSFDPEIRRGIQA